MIENGGFPIKYKQGTKEVEIVSEAKQVGYQCGI